MEIAILGAGMAGFGAAHRCHVQKLRATLYEKKPYHGGHTTSHRFSEGFTFDEGPHISFTKQERIKMLFAESVGGEYFESKAYVNNYWQGHWIPHPAQCNLYGLPEDLVVAVLQDFINGQNGPAPEIGTYLDWLYASFGKTFAETFPMQYTRKFHTTEAANLSVDWVGPRIYRPSLEEVLRGAVSASAPNVHYITEFRYPKHRGFVSFLDLFVEQADLRLGHQVVSVDGEKRTLTFANGSMARFDRLVSSLPLPELIPMIQGVPGDVLEAARRLACSEAVIVTIGVDRADLCQAHWTYFYDPEFSIVRLSTPHMQSPHNAPPGCGSFQAEIYFSKKYKPLKRQPAEYVDLVIDDLRRCGLLKEADQVVFRHALHVPYANVIFDLDRAAALKLVHGYLDDLGIAYCGRYGEWAYIWTDESFVSGENAAQRALDRSAP
ncbi:MAG TPA: FAD-dependent oxidoreductase [Vicinamibacteria bacterium]|nr:FAD-dependent oxidoreductase [Vicinamibacteria bacterium]